MTTIQEGPYIRINQLKNEIMQIGLIDSIEAMQTVISKSTEKSISLENLQLTPHQQEALQKEAANNQQSRQESIQQLKLKLGELSKEVQQKLTQKEELQKLLEDGTLEMKNAEKKLRVEIRKTNEEIDGILIQKDKDIKIFNAEKISLRSVVDKLEADIRLLQAERVEASSIYTQIKEESEQSYAAKVAKFNKAMEPMEESLRAIESQKEATLKSISDEKSKYTTLDSDLNKLSEETTNRTKKNEEMEQVLDKCREEVNAIKEKYPAEYELFYDDIKTKEAKREITNGKEAIKQKLSANEAKRIELTRSYTKIKEDISQLIPQQKELSEKLQTAKLDGVQDIETLEEQLNQFTTQLQLPSIYDTVADILQSKNFNYEAEVLACQIESVDKSIASLQANLDKDESQIISLIAKAEEEKSKLEDMLNQISKIAFENKSEEEIESESQHRRELVLKEEQIRVMKTKHNENKEATRIKINQLQQWKEENYKEPSQSQIDLGETTTEESIVKQIIDRINNPDQKITFDTLYKKYRILLNRREDSIQTAISKHSEVDQRLASQVKAAELQSSYLINLEKEYNEFKEESMKLVINENILEDKSKLRHNTLLQALTKIGEGKFNEYMKKNEHLFGNIKKNYGTKIMEKMMSDQKNEFSQIMHTEHQERIEIFRKNTEIIANCNKVIEENNELITGRIAAEIELKSKLFQMIKSNLATLNAQLIAITDAEHKLSAEIEEKLIKKKIQLLNSFQSFIFKRNFDQISKKVHNLDAALKEKGELLKEYYDKVHQLESDIRAKIANHKMTILQRQGKAESQQQEITEIQTILRPQLDEFALQVKEYKDQILNGQKKIELISGKLNIDTLGEPKQKRPASKKSIPFDMASQNDPSSVVKKEPAKKEEANPIEIDSSKYGTLSVSIPVSKDSKISCKVAYSSSNMENSICMVNLDECSFRECQLFESIKKLIEGVTLYKVLNPKISISKKKVFDPSNPKVTPESCGFAKREFRLEPSLTTIEIRNTKQIGTIFMGTNVIRTKDPN